MLCLQAAHVLPHAYYYVASLSSLSVAPSLGQASLRMAASIFRTASKRLATLRTMATFTSARPGETTPAIVDTHRGPTGVLEVRSRWDLHRIPLMPLLSTRRCLHRPGHPWGQPQCCEASGTRRVQLGALDAAEKPCRQ